MANLWTGSTAEKRKQALKFKFSKKTLSKLKSEIFIDKNDDLNKKYSNKISSRTWNKILK